MKKHVINLKRLMETLKISNKVGQICETGVRRITLTKEDKIMRDIFTSWLEEEGLDVRVDDFGNIYGRREGLRNDLAPVMTGSHLDTQPFGGRYDGILGVLSALEMMKVLNENNVQTLRPIEIVNFTNEEGHRFNATSGSEGITNISTKEKLHNDKDDKGTSFKEALEKIGYLGDEKNRPKEIHSYVELHIEQGPILEQENKSIGIVEGDTGSEEMEIIVKGKTGHATATPMEMRKDALIKAAEIIVMAQEVTKELEGTLTVGKLDMEPEGFHIIREVTIPMTILHPDISVRDQMIETINEKAIALVEQEEMEIEIKESLFKASTAYFSEPIRNEIETVVQDLGYTSLKMMSRGFHDANNIATIAPTGMLFIPCKDGISHSVEEFVSEKDIEKGANVLLHTVLNLAQQEDALQWSPASENKNLLGM